MTNFVSSRVLGKLVAFLHINHRFVGKILDFAFVHSSYWSIAILPGISASLKMFCFEMQVFSMHPRTINPMTRLLRSGFRLICTSNLPWISSVFASMIDWGNMDRLSRCPGNEKLDKISGWPRWTLQITGSFARRINERGWRWLEKTSFETKVFSASGCKTNLCGYEPISTDRVK